MTSLRPSAESAGGRATGVAPIGRVEASSHARTASTYVLALRDGGAALRPDTLVAEEPLEIRVRVAGGEAEAIGVTMRTPGNDFELAAGFLVTEGIVAEPTAISHVRYCTLAEGEEQRYNIVTVDVGGTAVELEGRRRAVTMNASCGLCGTASLEQLERRCQPLEPGPVVPAEVLLGLPDELRRAQAVFERTGGLHGAGLFDAEGMLLAVREDVGRHNAVDKLIGWAALQRRLPLARQVLCVSGRLSFEIVQKAAVAGIPIVVAVSAPSSLAVATASRLGMTLLAFVRDGRGNCYAGAERVGLVTD
jgi:FdhD protein